MSKTRRKSLGQYFTPVSVIDCALDALAWLDRKGDSSRRRVIDPACGDGGFLHRVIDRGFAKPATVAGLDKDEDLAVAWEQNGRGPAEGPLLEVADGLLADHFGRVSIAEESFDWVIGNPPYAGEGLKNAAPDDLAKIADTYELARLRWKNPGSPERLRALPIEILFVERFWRLCRPGGFIAIVLPVGVFANTRWRFVREWLLARVTLHGVIGLPRKTFRAGGITARTCLALAGKAPAPDHHQVFFAEAEHIGLDDEENELPALLELWKNGETVATDERPWRLD